jgi:hypothetical protein
MVSPIEVWIRDWKAGYAAPVVPPALHTDGTPNLIPCGEEVVPFSPDLVVFETNLRAAFEEMVALLLAKRQAYGPGNLVRFGAISIVIRASDKIDRLANLLKAGETTSADGESIEDAFRDLVGYGVLGLLHERGKLVP